MLRIAALLLLRIAALLLLWISGAALGRSRHALGRHAGALLLLESLRRHAVCRFGCGEDLFLGLRRELQHGVGLFRR